MNRRINGIVAVLLLMVTGFAMAIPTQAATGDLVSSSPTLVIFKLDRNSGYGYWLDASEANQVVQNKIKPALRNARPSDYKSYFDSKPEWYTRQYLWEDLITSDLMYHYNYLRGTTISDMTIGLFQRHIGIKKISYAKFQGDYFLSPFFNSSTTK